ncbi:hypothetical protein BD770DRAFT_392159 [Pilaira anomala]|nr:hypothetical protein BD770DRAFT_392159 [Pilaira anomala]
MNSILDLSYKFGDVQSTLFTEDQWLNLQSRFPVKVEEDSEINDNLLKLTDEFNSIMTSIIQSKSSFGKKLKKLSSWLKRLEDQYKKLNAEESYFVYLLKHLIKLYTKSSYIFNPDIDCSKWDYVIKIWAPIIEELFDETDLRSKWGDTVYKAGNEDGNTSLKIDLRIIIDKMIQRRNVENEIASGEFAKYDPGNLKCQSDRCKVMIEGKTVINNVISRGLEMTYIPVLHICGTELYFLVISSVPTWFICWK